MANTPSARKRIRTNAKKRLRNMMYRSRAKTMLKKAEQTIAQDAPSEEAIRVAISTLDKAASKGIIHRNNAARRKSRLMKKIQHRPSSAGLTTSGSACSSQPAHIQHKQFQRNIGLQAAGLDSTVGLE